MKKIWLVFSLFLFFFISFQAKAQWFLKNPAIPANMNEIFFVSENIGWIVGKGFILKTTNDGVNWNYQAISQTVNLKAVFFIDENLGWAVGADGKILSSSDGGITWSDPVNTSGLKFNSIDILELNNIWVVGGRFPGTDRCIILHSTDMGATWINKVEGSRKKFFACSFYDINNGIAVGDSNVVLYSTDGGTIWKNGTIETIDNLRLYSVSKSYQNIAYTIGDCYTQSGVQRCIFKTSNGGQYWVDLGISSYGYGPLLVGVYFITSNIGWTVGWDGTILKTIDGGQTWINQSSGIQSPLVSVFFINENLGWCVGSGGNIIHTTDGGNNWFTQLSGVTYQLNGISFINSQEGWIAGGVNTGPGVILKTSDGGNNWVKTVDGEFGGLWSIKFLNNNIGFASGTYGTIIKSIDGGLTWKKQYSGTDVYLTGDFIDEYNGWVVGQDGTILHTTNGGVTFIEDENNFAQLKQFLLQQNYPNPFNPSTKISWQAPASGWQTLKVYDILGNEVATLVNEFKEAGNYEVEFKSTVGSHQLANGVYFYQLRTGDFVETKKMILLK